jgi:cytochrome b
MAELTSRGHPGWSVVWDPFVRIFHWCTVGLVAVAFFSDADRAVHDTAGYVVFALVVARIAWGLIGPAHARFSDFLAPPGHVLRYLRDIPAGRARRYLGHNPAGGVMIVALIVLLLVTVVSGWLSETDAFFGIAWVSHLHHRAAHLLLVLIGLHVLGVVVSSVLHRENLVQAMITGRKRNDSGGIPHPGDVQAEIGPSARPASGRDRAAMGRGNFGNDRQS